MFLDADTLVVRNMDEAFRCPGFCASLRHSERLNSGVMVLHPSKALFADMISQVDRLPSYTGCADSLHERAHAYLWGPRGSDVGPLALICCGCGELLAEAG